MPDFYYFLLFLPLPLFLLLSISLNKLVLIVTSPMVACSASVMYHFCFHLLELQISHVSASLIFATLSPRRLALLLSLSCCLLFQPHTQVENNPKQKHLHYRTGWICELPSESASSGKYDSNKHQWQRSQSFWIWPLRSHMGCATWVKAAWPVKRSVRKGCTVPICC